MKKSIIWPYLLLNFILSSAIYSQQISREEIDDIKQELKSSKLEQEKLQSRISSLSSQSGGNKIASPVSVLKELESIRADAESAKKERDLIFKKISSTPVSTAKISSSEGFQNELDHLKVELKNAKKDRELLFRKISNNPVSKKNTPSNKLEHEVSKLKSELKKAKKDRGVILKKIAKDSKKNTGNSKNTENVDSELSILKKDRDLLFEKIVELETNSTKSNKSKTTLGGYGEVHFQHNNTKGSKGKDFSDPHRIVLFIGHAFNSWIQLNSEIELEHGFSSKNSGGEVVLEQAAIDFNISDEFGIRVGRILAPLGLINQFHEPTTFNGVERPNFAKYIIPSTFSLDGAGVFGTINNNLEYQGYITNGLDGSQFDASNGIRSGRMKERPGLNQPAFSGRVSLSLLKDLKVGVSLMNSGIANSNKGANDPRDIPSDVRLSMYGADIVYKKGIFDFKTSYGVNNISNVEKLNLIYGNNVAEQMTGFFAEVGVHVLDNINKNSDQDLIAFTRYDSYNTQAKVVGFEKNKKYDRSDITFGLTYLPTPGVAVKLDHQIFKDQDSKTKDSNQTNFGIGWSF